MLDILLLKPERGKHTRGETARVSACLTVVAMLGTRRNPHYL